jgi:hypothetical protein
VCVELSTSTVSKVFAAFCLSSSNRGVGWLCATMLSYDGQNIWDKLKLVCLPNLLNASIW